MDDVSRVSSALQTPRKQKKFPTTIQTTPTEEDERGETNDNKTRLGEVKKDRRRKRRILLLLLLVFLSSSSQQTERMNTTDDDESLTKQHNEKVFFLKKIEFHRDKKNFSSSLFRLSRRFFSRFPFLLSSLQKKTDDG